MPDQLAPRRLPLVYEDPSTHRVFIEALSAVREDDVWRRGAIGPDLLTRDFRLVEEPMRARRLCEAAILGLDPETEYHDLNCHHQILQSDSEIIIGMKREGRMPSLVELLSSLAHVKKKLDAEDTNDSLSP